MKNVPIRFYNVAKSEYQKMKKKLKVLVLPQKVYPKLKSTKFAKKLNNIISKD
jgi:hypothetical protein